MFLETLLSAALGAGLSLITEAGFGTEIRDLKDGLTDATERKRRESFERAFGWAREVSDDAVLRPLLEHRPFQEEVVRALLDPAQGFNVQAVAADWQDRLPQHGRALRQFFTHLEEHLLADETWGPILTRFQEWRFRDDVLQALRARHQDIPVQQIVHDESLRLTGSGAMAADHSVAAGAGGVAVGGDFHLAIYNTHQAPPPAGLQEAYLNSVMGQVQAVSLSGVDPKGIDEQTRQDLDLAAVYTGLMTQRQEGPVARGLRSEREDRWLSALEVLNAEPHLALLGDPGSGKSTFVNFVTLCMAGELLRHPEANLAALTTPVPHEGRRRRRDEDAPPAPTVGSRAAAADPRRPARLRRPWSPAYRGGDGPQRRCPVAVHRQGHTRDHPRCCTVASRSVIAPGWAALARRTG